MSVVRKHFCTDVSRDSGGAWRPRKYGLNGTMPALVKSRLGIVRRDQRRANDRPVPLPNEILCENAPDSRPLAFWLSRTFSVAPCAMFVLPSIGTPPR